MKIQVIITLLFIVSCNSATPQNCISYVEGVKYFNLHNHGDYVDSGSLDTSIAFFQKALKVGCRNYDLYYKLFFCYHWNGDFKNAEKYISEAIMLDKNKNLELYYYRGELNMRLNRLEQAESDFNTYVTFSKAIYPKEGFYRLGVIQYILGDSINSKINMAKAVQLNKGKKLRDFKEFAEAWGLKK